MRLKSPMLVNGKDDLTDSLSEKLLLRQTGEGRTDAIRSSYEFLMTKMGYSQRLAAAATGYVPPLD